MNQINKLIVYIKLITWLMVLSVDVSICFNFLASKQSARCYLTKQQFRGKNGDSSLEQWKGQDGPFLSPPPPNKSLRTTDLAGRQYDLVLYSEVFCHQLQLRSEAADS